MGGAEGSVSHLGPTGWFGVGHIILDISILWRIYVRMALFQGEGFYNY